MANEVLALLIGLMASLIGSMSGLAGGFLAVPLLYYLGIYVRYVVATSKFMAFTTSLVSTWRYSRSIKIPLKLYVPIVVPMTIFSYLGAYLVAILPTRYLTLSLGVILLCISLGMALRGGGKGDESSDPVKERNRAALQALSGAFAGFVAGISGLGGGVVNVTIFIYVLKMSPHLAISLSLACILPSSFISVIRHLADGLIYWEIAIPLSLGALVGGWIGPRIAMSLKEEVLRRIIGGVIAISALHMVINALSSI